MALTPLRSSLLTAKAVAAALFVLVWANPAQGQEPASPARGQAEAHAQQPLHCSSCGVELLPQTRAYHDRGGNRICADCAAKEEDGPYDLWTTDALTGDWGGARTKLEDAGISIGLTLGSVWQSNLRGGENTHNAHDITGEGLSEIEFDLETMFGLKGASLFVAAKHTWNDGIGEDLGSLSDPYSGPGAPSGDREAVLHKYHYRQRLFDDRLEFRLGMLDSGDVFDTNEYANSAGGQFPNAMLKRNPTYPTPKGLGVFVQAWPTDWLYVAAAAIDPDTIETYNRRGAGGFDTAFHGEDRFFLTWEFGVLPSYFPGGEGLLPGHYRFGAWLDSQGKPIFFNDLDGRLSERLRSGDVGWYFNMDQLVWKENDDPADDQGLGIFARYGFAHPDVNEINHFWSVGGSYLGLIPSRDDDVLGFGVAQSILSKTLRHNVDSSADRETVYDLYYKIPVTPWCNVTPDVQVITNPGGSEDGRDAVVGGVRVEIAF